MGTNNFKMNFSYRAMTRAEWAPIFAFLARQRGQHESFRVVLPGPSPKAGR